MKDNTSIVVTPPGIVNEGTRVIGIVGGIASGKSLVTGMFREMGAATIDADRLGHEVLDDADVQQALRSRWGESVFVAGKVHRPAVAQIVFGERPESAEELRFLREVTHPRIADRLRAAIDAWSRQGVPVIVIDAAIMVEAGWHHHCDFLVFVDAPLEQRIARSRTRGWPAEDLRRREARQMPLPEKKGLANFVIDNSGDHETTRQQVLDVWRQVAPN